MDAADLDVLKAISFAARAHRHQVRKDGHTPYAAHAFRVAHIARHDFGIDDPEVLTIAVLHDTIEDTTTDYDDLVEGFGERVARGVAALTKDMRLPEAEREAAYLRQVAEAEPAVHLCKLADIADNLIDGEHLAPAARAKSLARARAYLDHFDRHRSPETDRALAIVTELWLDRTR